MVIMALSYIIYHIYYQHNHHHHYIYVLISSLISYLPIKVINSCTNLDELGMPSMITSYNAKPVLIRRTGSIFRGKNYLEMNIHVHKFATMAKQSIYQISSRCGVMFMQIGS